MILTLNFESGTLNRGYVPLSGKGSGGLRIA